MFDEKQASSDGTLSQFVRVGPVRSSFERLFCGVDVSVSLEWIDRSVLKLRSAEIF
jgi:hypothetical protein